MRHRRTLRQRHGTATSVFEIATGGHVAYGIAIGYDLNAWITDDVKGGREPGAPAGLDPGRARRRAGYRPDSSGYAAHRHRASLLLASGASPRLTRTASAA